MTKTESLIRFILGTVRGDIRPLAAAIDCAVDLLFIRDVPMDDILVTKDIYPEVAKIIRNRDGVQSSASAVAKRVERLANQCWHAIVERGLVLEYVGEPLRDIRAPSDLIFYLAFYVYFDEPFFSAIKKQPELLF